MGGLRYESKKVPLSGLGRGTKTFRKKRKGLGSTVVLVAAVFAMLALAYAMQEGHKLQVQNSTNTDVEFVGLPAEPKSK